MKLLVIGFGQCGGRIADEFARLNRRAHNQRGIDIITGAFAVNTDAADLSGLVAIRRDFQHRILIGGRKTGGHGVGKINELGAEIAREDGDTILESIKTTKYFHETDAFLLVASAAGGTGSGAVPVLTEYLKDHYAEKPVYNLITLPFKHEERVEERTIYNTATCLKSVYLVADAVFLVDNQRYVKKDSSLQDNLSTINAQAVEPFYNLLCAGEEKQAKYIGAKILDAGDIIQTLAGWTVIGYGKSDIPFFKFPFDTSDFRKKGTDTHKGIQVMDEAISELSLKCRPSDAKRALYLLSGPLAGDAPPAGVHLPPVVADVLHLHQPVDQVAGDLDEQTEVRHARHHPLELLADAVDQHPQDVDLPEFPFGPLGAVLGEAAMRAQLLEIQRLGELGDRTFLLSARRPQICVQQTVDDQVRVSPDRRSEMGIMSAGQRIVSDALGRILGLLQAAEHGQVNGERPGLASGRVEQVLNGFAPGITRHLVAQRPEELAHRPNARFVRIGMDATQERPIETIEQSGDGLVGLHHEHLDDGVAKGGVGRLDVHGSAPVVELDLDLRQVQHQHPVGEPPLPDRPRQRVGAPDQGHDLAA